jgi:outer membrane protein assembly factor BamB
MWNYSARGRISPYITRSREGTSYFSRTNGTLIALNRAGRELWQRDIGSPLVARIVIGWDGRLFVPVEKRIFCYTASGTLLWTRSLESAFTITPVLDRSGGIIFTLENQVYRIDPFGNTYVWVLPSAPVSVVSIEGAAGSAVSQSTDQRHRIMVLHTDGTMEILGTSQDWFIGAQSEVHATLLPRLPSRPLAAAGKDSNAAVVLSDGRVAFVSTEERRILWTGDSHLRGRQENEIEIVFDERGIYILSRSGATGFSHEGRRMWFKHLQNTAAIPAFGDDGVLYSGGRDWILYAYKIEDRILPRRNVFYGPTSESSYGLGRPQSIFVPSVPYNENEISNRLETIGNAITEGRVGSNEPAWTSFLLTLSASQHKIVFRIAAINLLGKIGSQDTIPWLVNIFDNENEPTVKSTAITAIGEIGVDPGGIALRTFLNIIIYNPSLKNEQVLSAIASATGAICRFSGPPLTETGVRILTLLSAASQPPIVRRQANRELATLR